MYEIFEQLLQEKKATAYQVHKATGISTGSLSDWKMGRSTPKAEKMQKIADFFNVTLDYLMGREDKNNCDEDVLARFAALLNEYPSNSINIVSNLCKTERVNQDLTEKFIANNTQVSLDDYLEFESSYKNIGADKIIRILSFLKINIDYITGYITGILTNNSPSIKEANSIIDKIISDETLKNELLALQKIDLNELKAINDTNNLNSDEIEKLRAILSKFSTSKNIR